MDNEAHCRLASRIRLPRHQGRKEGRRKPLPPPPAASRRPSRRRQGRRKEGRGPFMNPCPMQRRHVIKEGRKEEGSRSRPRLRPTPCGQESLSPARKKEGRKECTHRPPGPAVLPRHPGSRKKEEGTSTPPAQRPGVPLASKEEGRKEGAHPQPPRRRHVSQEGRSRRKECTEPPPPSPPRAG